MGLLESLLGPAVAGLNAPTARGRGKRTTNPPPTEAEVAPAPTPPSLPAVARPPLAAPPAAPHGSMTALLAAETPVGLAVRSASTMTVNRANMPFINLIGKPWTETQIIGRT